LQANLYKKRKVKSIIFQINKCKGFSGDVRLRPLSVFLSRFIFLLTNAIIITKIKTSRKLLTCNNQNEIHVIFDSIID